MQSNATSFYIDVIFIVLINSLVNKKKFISFYPIERGEPK